MNYEQYLDKSNPELHFTKADKILVAVMNELLDRSGIQNAIEECDLDIKNELFETLTEKIQEKL